MARKHGTSHSLLFCWSKPMGDGNGTYTTIVLRHIGTKDQPIEVFLKKVWVDVDRAMPWEHSSLMGDFYFAP